MGEVVETITVYRMTPEDRAGLQCEYGFGQRHDGIHGRCDGFVEYERKPWASTPNTPIWLCHKHAEIIWGVM